MMEEEQDDLSCHETGGLTRLLAHIREGKAEPASAVPLVYEELRRLARRCMEGQPLEHTLGATDVLHESLLRLVQARGSGWSDREHLVRWVGKTIRSVLVDHARAKGSLKRRAPGNRVLLDPVAAELEERCTDLAALDAALEELGRLEPRLVEVVELRFFCGLTIEEVAESLGLSTRQVDRDWKLARGILRDRIGEMEV